MWRSFCLQLMRPGLGQVGRPGPAPGWEVPWKREAPRPQKWGRYPEMGAPDLFPGDSEKEDQSKLCKSGQKTEVRIYRLPGLALQTTPELTPSPKLHPDFLGQRFPTHQTDPYFILYYIILFYLFHAFDGSRQLSLPTLPPFSLHPFFCCPPPQIS